MLPLLPLAVAGLAGLAWFKVKRKNPTYGVMTAERKVVYETALSTLKDPDKLHELSKAYHKQGLPDAAEMLVKRANLRALPADIKAARKQAFLQGLSSKDPDAVYALATAFLREGATGAAAKLQEYAAGLRGVQQGAVATREQAAEEQAASQAMDQLDKEAEEEEVEDEVEPDPDPTEVEEEGPVANPISDAVDIPSSDAIGTAPSTYSPTETLEQNVAKEAGQVLGNIFAAPVT